MRYPFSRKIRLLCILLTGILIALSACSPRESSGGTTSAADPNRGTSAAGPGQSTEAADPGRDDSAALEEQARFSSYTYDQFLESVLDNTINLHYTVADPESYGITEYPITLGSYEQWTEEDILADLDEMASDLASFRYDLLTDEQKMTYDLLQQYLRVERNAASLYLYAEPLGPTTGAAAQLPITLAEYSFYREQDIKDYLQLLPLIGDYFASIVEFEQARADAGVFMNEFTLDDNLEICEDFLENKDGNYLISSFASRMEEIDWLDDEAKAAYTEQNRQAVFDSVFPAYEYLAEELEKMREFCGDSDVTLADLPDGDNYFTYLMDTRIGPDRTVDEMLSLIESYMLSQLQEMGAIMNRTPSVADDFYEFAFELSDPAECLDYLKETIAKDFPEIPDTSYTIRYVEKELEDVLSPAFYMIPPLDRYLENTIYINNGSVDPETLFPTLAHEGYPGHLYQNVYFNSHNTEPLRSMISFLGYSEGWATYVEYESYLYDKTLDPDLARFVALNQSVALGLYASLDININYNGWTRDQAGEYARQFFNLEDSDVDAIYEALVGDPCYYLAYHGGYLEILELRSAAEKALGSRFDLKEFHRFFLDLGECPFSLANDRLEDWLAAQQ